METKKKVIPISAFTEPIALFLAGIFGFKISTEMEPFSVTNINIFPVAIVLFIAAFILLINIFELKFVLKIKNIIPKKIGVLVYFLLLIVTTAEVFIKIAETGTSSILFYIGIIFLILFVVALAFSAIKDIKNANNTTLLSLSVLYIGFAIYSFLIKKQTLSTIIMFALFGVLLLGLAIKRLTTKEKVQGLIIIPEDQYKMGVP